MFRKVAVKFQAVAAAHADQPPELFLLIWGLVVSAVGLALVTNFRGYADHFGRRGKGSVRPRRSLVMVRLLGLPFAIVGLIVIVTALVTSRGRFPIATRPPVPLASPVQYLFIVVTVAIVAWWWISPRGFFSGPSPRRGGRLAAAVIASLGALTFGVSLAVAEPTVGFVALAACALTAAVLQMGRKPPGEGRD